MAQQRDGYGNYMSNPGYGMNSPNQPQPQQLQQQPQNLMNMQQPNHNFAGNPNVDPTFFYQQQQFLQQQQQQQRQATSPQQLQQQQMNYLRAQQQHQLQQQQQQQQQQHGYNPNGYNNYSPQHRPPPSQQQQPSPQQQISPMLMNTSPIGNRPPNPNLMYNPMMNRPMMQQQPQQQQQQHSPQQQMRPPPPQQFPPGYGQPRPNGYPQQQLTPQQMQAYQQQLQRQQMQRQQMMMQQQGFDPRFHQLQPLPNQHHHQQQQQHFMMQQQHQIQLQQHLHQQQMQQRQLAEQNRPKRPTRNATKKKRVYDMSSEEEEDFDLESEESEASAGSDFDDSDEGHSKKKNNAAAVAAEPEEPVMIPMGTKVFERILDYRRNEDTGDEELLIKYKNTSFLHVEWVPLEQIENEHLGKHRVKKFLQKYHADGDKGEDFKEYLKMDRVIDDGELEDPATGESRVYYLVKWNGSFYDASTWETEEDVRKCDSVLLDEFLARKVIPQEKTGPSPPRPDVSRFTHYAASPAYKYNNSLRPYQLEGLNWLRYCYYSFRSCILADEMGLGKTVQSVALLNDIYQNLQIRGPFLIIAPLSTIPHWTRAFNAWTDLNVIDFRGSTMARNLIVETEFHYQDMEGNTIPNKFKFDVLITTYEMASAGAMTLKDIPWRCGVFDEAHRLKNKNSKVLEILKTFYMDHKLLLTGTPLQNNLGELYSLLQFMQPDIYNDEEYFFSEYGSLKSAHEVEKLQALLQPIMLRRFKEDVEKTIPVKEETVIEVELTNPQKKWYRAILEKNFSFLKKGTKSNKEMPHLRNIMMQLRKCCIHPYLLEGAEDVIVSECNATGSQEQQFNCLVQSSGKLVLIDKLLRKLIQGNHKVLIFSQFTSCLDILADYLRGRSYAYERIDGSVPGDQRQAAIDRFSTLPIEESFVFLLCTRAGGVGINLTAADTCIIFDSDWNPQNDLQAQARCHRIGQTKPVQIYRLICANTYEKDMFDRAGMKLGLDKAVMGTHDDGSTNKTAELNRKEIEDLLKKGAYGAMLDDEASAKFCEEDIDQILERRTTVIRHEGNEKGSVFSKATFSAAVDDDNAGVDLDDPDFWEKWAAKAQIDTTELPDENTLIVSMPRRRRQVQRFGSRPADGSYSSNDDAGDSDAAYEEELEPKSSRRGGRSDQVRPWTLSEKTKYERKLMIYGYGSWNLMVAHFPRRTEKDLKAVTRALMRKVLPVLENVKKTTEEDRKLVQDIKNILINDARDEVKKNESIPYIGATKKQIAEFKSFLIQAPEEYIDHVERKGRNFLLRIQMLHLIRDKIVPTDWEEAKALEMPKVTGLPPAPWWGENEDRCLLLGICKHGYQQYLAMRNDPEFTFYGRKYDDSQSGVLEDDDATPANDKNDDSSRQPSVEPAPFIAKKTAIKRDDDSDYEDKNDKDYSDDEDFDDKNKVYVWPSKADIGMRLRRIIAAFLRERANSNRKRKMQEKVEKKENDRQTRQRQKETRAAQRQRARQSEVSNRWTKKNKSDFLKTLMSFGVERDEDDFLWGRFKEIAGLEKKTDDALTQHYREVYATCEESVKRYVSENGQAAAPANADETPVSSPKEHVDGGSRESSVEPNENSRDDHDSVVPYDKARRSLKRIDQMNTIREKVLLHPDLDSFLLKARKTSGLPTWWEVPKHDKALLEAICKHGIGRTDLIIEDPDLPFYHVKQSLVGDDEETEAEGEDDDKSTSKFVWPRDLVVARRIDSLCDLVLNPKPLTIRQARKRKSNTGSSTNRKKTKVDPVKNEEALSDEEMEEDEDEDADAEEEDEGNNAPSPAADEHYQQVPSEVPQPAPIKPEESVTTTPSIAAVDAVAATAPPVPEEEVAMEMQEDKEEEKVQEPVRDETQV